MRVKSLMIIFSVILLGLSLSGCGCFMQQIKGETPPPPAPSAQVVPPEVKPVVPVVPVPPSPPQISEPVKPEAPKPVAAPVLKDINFDFDKYNIRAKDAEILKNNLEWFNANKGKKVRIEGHCDERGTIEYNLVLGQKRADSTKAYLVNLGVDPNLLETVSYGKERPLDPGHNEDAWAKNRRAHFLPLQ
ncbi:MAG: peptidoglycan-associated lipoprotein Pal [Syntrophorhabdaceae bacterium]|nr:peptidoglycan-associated lipoprotein Pal [Syntrophorhabdaceae bacterium]